MKLQSYLQANGVRLLAVAVFAVAFAFGVIDPSAAIAGGILLEATPDLKTLHAEMQKAFKAMEDGVKKAQDTASNALEEIRREGSVFGKTNDALKALGETNQKLAADVKDAKDRLVAIEQASAKKPGGDDKKSPGMMVAASAEWAASKGKTNMPSVMVGSFHNVAIVTPETTGTISPLVAPDRQTGIVMPALRRLTVRDLLPQRTTESDMIEFTRELVFTNNAGPQYDASSPAAKQQTAVKNESGITFEFVQVPVTTLAHWIPASRQVMADAKMLAGYVDGRLRYGLKFEEEDELLNGSGSSGELDGLVGQASAFTGGVTNQTALDTLLKAFLQVSLAEYEASGVILNPIDWTNILLLKDNEGRYLFSDPHGQAMPQVWGKPVVPTQSMTAGSFLTGAFMLGAEIVDREDATVRVSEHHENFFIKNMVAVLCEERLALVVIRPTAFVIGSLNYAG